MFSTQTQPATFATAGYPAVGVVAVALNPVCVSILSAIGMALISWQDRKATHATPVRPTPPGSSPSLR